MDARSFNSRVNLSTSLMCALRIFHWNLIAGNFFTQDCEKKLIVRGSKNVFMHARNGA